MANAAARPKPKLMTVITTGLRDAWEAGVSLRMRGTVCAVAGAILMASLATYNAADPSWDVAAPTAARNAMGGFGADIADVSLQALGLAVWIAALLMVAAGVRRAGAADPHGERLDQRLRGFAGGGGVVILAACLAAPLPPASWPLASGLGGWMGESLLGALANLIGRTDLPAPRLVAVTLLAPACLWALAYGAGLRWSEMQDFAAWLIGRGARARAATAGAAERIAVAGRRTGLDEAPQAGEPPLVAARETVRAAKPARGTPRAAKPNPLDSLDEAGGLVHAP